MLSSSSSLEERGLSHSVQLVRFSRGAKMMLNTHVIGTVLAWTSLLAASGFIVAVALLA